MAANRSQGSYYTLLLVSATVFCAGIAYLEGGSGKLMLVIGAAGLLASLFGMLKIKPLEGKTALKPGPGAMKLAGAGVCALGWLITLVGMHITPSTSGRIVLALVGIGVSLFGMLVILPAAFNKNAVWKS
ncbi:MAG: hypothetical protein LAN59_04345 [Acidobacteriia bacterium]|nr:hypothetical protein [Terriglobia bacterium]